MSASTFSPEMPVKGFRVHASHNVSRQYEDVTFDVSVEDGSDFNVTLTEDGHVLREMSCHLKADIKQMTYPFPAGNHTLTFTANNSVSSSVFTVFLVTQVPLDNLTITPLCSQRNCSMYTSVGPPRSQMTCLFNYGDNTGDSPCQDHVYGKCGSYRIVAVCSNLLGTVTREVNVSVSVPTHLHVTYKCALTTCMFKWTVDPASHKFMCQVDFGDLFFAVVTESDEEEHVYNESGNYNASVRCYGNCSNEFRPVNVTVLEPVSGLKAKCDSNVADGDMYKIGVSIDKGFPVEINYHFGGLQFDRNGSYTDDMTWAFLYTRSPMHWHGSLLVHVNASNGQSFQNTSCYVTVVESIREVVVLEKHNTTFVKVNQTLEFVVTAATGSNVTCHVMPGDGQHAVSVDMPSNMTGSWSLVNISYSQAGHFSPRFYLVNPVSKSNVSLEAVVQQVVGEIVLTAVTPVAVGRTATYSARASGMPTDPVCYWQFANGTVKNVSAEALTHGRPLTENVTYDDSAVGNQRVAVNCSNHVSWSNASTTVVVEEMVSGLRIHPKMTPTALGNNSTISFTVKKGSHLTYDVDVDDNGVHYGGNSFYPSTFNVSHTYNTTGNYTISVIVSNDVNNMSASGTEMVVQPSSDGPGLIACTHYNVSVPTLLHVTYKCALTTCMFKWTVDPASHKFMCQVDFGDLFFAVVTESDEEEHVYNESGNYNASVRCYGNCSNEFHPVNVTVLEPVSGLKAKCDSNVADGDMYKIGVSIDKGFPVEINYQFGGLQFDRNGSYTDDMTWAFLYTRSPMHWHGSLLVHVNASNGYSFQNTSCYVTVVESIREVVVLEKHNTTFVKVNQTLEFVVTAATGSNVTCHVVPGDGQHAVSVDMPSNMTGSWSLVNISYSQAGHFSPRFYLINPVSKSNVSLDVDVDDNGVHYRGNSFYPSTFNVSHTYNTTGNYTIRVIVSNDVNNMSASGTEIVVQPSSDGPGLTARIRYNDYRLVSHASTIVMNAADATEYVDQRPGALSYTWYCRRENETHIEEMFTAPVVPLPTGTFLVVPRVPLPTGTFLVVSRVPLPTGTFLVVPRVPLPTCTFLVVPRVPLPTGTFLVVLRVPIPTGTFLVVPRVPLPTGTFLVVPRVPIPTGTFLVVPRVPLPTGTFLVVPRVPIPTGTFLVVPRVPLPTGTFLVVPRVPLPTGTFLVVPWVHLPTGTFLVVPRVPLPTGTFLVVPKVPIPTGTFLVVPRVTLPTGTFLLFHRVLLPTGTFLVVPRVLLPTGTFLLVHRVPLPTGTFLVVPRVPLPTGTFLVVPRVPLPTCTFLVVPMVPLPTGTFLLVPRVPLPTGTFLVVPRVLLPTGTFMLVHRVPLPTGTFLEVPRVPLPTGTFLLVPRVPRPTGTFLLVPRVPLPTGTFLVVPMVPVPTCTFLVAPVVPVPTCTFLVAPIVPRPTETSLMAPIVPLPTCTFLVAPMVPVPTCTFLEAPIVPVPKRTFLVTPMVPVPTCTFLVAPMVHAPTCTFLEAPIVPVPTRTFLVTPMVPVPTCTFLVAPMVHAPTCTFLEAPIVPVPTRTFLVTPMVPVPTCTFLVAPMVPRPTETPLMAPIAPLPMGSPLWLPWSLVLQ